MAKTKSLLASKTFWGSIASAVIVVGQSMGWFSATEVQTIQANLNSLLVAGAGLIASAVTIWGRISATKGIK